MVQTLIVGLIVVAALFYSAGLLLPAALRGRLIGALLARLPLRPRWLVRLSEPSALSGCGSCHACAPDHAVAGAIETAAPTESSGTSGSVSPAVRSRPSGFASSQQSVQLPWPRQTQARADQEPR